MKHYDKILCAAGVLVCLASVGVCVGLKPAGAKTVRASENGKEFAAWTDEGKFASAPAKWEDPKLDKETGWNYDLFTVPETTWLAGEKRYIAKELPVPPEEPFGVSLVSIENPVSSLRITTCSTDVPPRKAGKAGYSVYVAFADAHGEKVPFDFSKNSAKLSKEEIDGRTIFTLTPRKPVEIDGRALALKDFKIVRGQSETGDGSNYTRYMATFLDRENGDRELRVLEEFVRDASRVVAVFRDDNSPRRWRYTETFSADAEKPEIELAVRESESEPWTVVGKEPVFRLGDATYFVKVVDISAQQTTISKQSESNGKPKRPKVRQVVLDLVK
ncbi:MAG: hypothetical protein ACI4QA_02410 [Candidatus Spyradosoma sp.]